MIHSETGLHAMIERSARAQGYQQFVERSMVTASALVAMNAVAWAAATMEMAEMKMRTGYWG